MGNGDSRARFLTINGEIGHLRMMAGNAAQLENRSSVGAETKLRTHLPSHVSGRTKLRPREPNFGHSSYQGRIQKLRKEGSRIFCHAHLC